MKDDKARNTAQNCLDIKMKQLDWVKLHLYSKNYFGKFKRKA